MRDPDSVFINKLKKEMLENPTSLVSPIIGLVRLRPGEKFDNKHPNSYKYESIGGRIVLQELTKKYPENINYQIRLVAVYVGLTEDLVLRLAARHNRATEFTHTMTTQDKVLHMNELVVTACVIARTACLCCSSHDDCQCDSDPSHDACQCDSDPYHDDCQCDSDPSYGDCLCDSDPSHSHSLCDSDPYHGDCLMVMVKKFYKFI